jgi:hypothetical protein
MHMVSSEMRGRLFLLDLSGDRVVSLNSDGSDRKVCTPGAQLTSAK